jgi:hypothetical protein
MPFKSRAQRRALWAKNPKVAQEFENATPKGKKLPERKRRKKKKHNIFKAIPLWDGDGVQGAGQPRDRRGRWVRLPGPTATKKIGIWELENGKWGVFENGSEEPSREYTRHTDANRFVAKKIKEDAQAYYEQKVAPKKRAEHERRMEEASARDRRALAGGAAREGRERGRNLNRGVVGRVQGGTGRSRRVIRNRRKIEESNVEAPTIPGPANLQRSKEAERFANQEFKETEAKYAGLIIRLAKKGKTQDPAYRGNIKTKYGISPKRQMEIERSVYEKLYPETAPKEKRRNRFGGPTNNQQTEEMERHGGRSSLPLSTSPNNPPHLFKANKGENRGKWMVVSWNGHAEVIDDKEADRLRQESKEFWGNRMAKQKKRVKVVMPVWESVPKRGGGTKREKHYEERWITVPAYLRNKDGNLVPWEDRQKELRRDRIHVMELEEEKRLEKEEKIQIARDWADKMGFDGDDSYWWGFYWDDPSLISNAKNRGQQDDAVVPFEVNQPTARQRRKGRSLGEKGALPSGDLDARDYRGRRPGAKGSRKGDEDFQSSRQPPTQADRERSEREWERWREKEARRIARRRGKKNNGDVAKSVREVRKARHPFWDGDGVQGAGQPRNKHGEWTSGGRALARLASEVGERTAVAQYRTTTTRRSGASAGTATSRSARKTLGVGTAFDHSEKTIAIKPPRPNRGGKPWYEGILPESKLSQVGDAYYQRNNGTTAISDARLAQLFENPSKATANEKKLIASARGAKSIDGDRLIKIKTASGTKSRPRYDVIGQIAGKMVPGSGNRSGGAQARSGRSKEALARAQEKRRASGKENSLQQQKKVEVIAKDWAMSSTSVPCVHCGKAVRKSQISIETPKSKKIGGNYKDRGGMWPAHESCNTKAGAAANANPQLYLQDMMKKFQRNVPPSVKKNLPHVYAYFKKELGTYEAAKRKGFK